jgi:hypothetical protein
MQFGKGNVSWPYKGYQWTKTDLRIKRDVRTSDVEFLVKDFAPEIASGDMKLDQEGHITWEGLDLWVESHDWVPADEKELYAFARDPQTRGLRFDDWLIAFGSYVSIELKPDRTSLPALVTEGEKRFLMHIQYMFRFVQRRRFLFVRPYKADE